MLHLERLRFITVLTVLLVALVPICERAFIDLLHDISLIHPPLMFLQTDDLLVLKWPNQSDSSSTCFTPSTSPIIVPSLPLPPTKSTLDSSQRRRTSNSLGSHRVKPYTIPARSNSADESISKMPTGQYDPSWTSSPVQKARQGFTQERRGSDAASTASYSSLGNALGPNPFGAPHPSDPLLETRPSSSHSSVASNLSGAMVDTPGSNHSHHSNSPSPTAAPAASSQHFDVNMHPNSTMSWTPSPEQMITATQANYPGVPGPYSGSPSGSTNTHFENYDTTNNYRSSDAAVTPPNAYASSSYMDQSYSSNRMAGSQLSSPYSPYPNPERMENENRILRRKLRDMEMLYRSSQEQLHGLTGGMQLASNLGHGTPSPHSTPSPISPTFQASWNARTEARIRQFCSLNRAGNALCAWHDSRRERRAYPPRNAPPGYLNCGCTYEEALFEESLSRHQVGSYHPGESVRMDPALRNPLLKLLQQRYGYRDGDFERDSRTGSWVEGEGPTMWEQKVHAGIRGRTRGGDPNSRSG